MQQEAFPPFIDLGFEDLPPYLPYRLEEGPFYGQIPPEKLPAIGDAVRGLSPSKRLPDHSDEAAKDHREREELRERVLAKRLLLREKRRELRRQREKAGIAEARLASSIRRFYLQADPLKPEELLVQFGEVQAERDALGALDADYDEAEDQYEALEWTLDHGENEALLVVKPQVPYEEHFRLPVVAEYLSHIGEAEMLREELIDLRMEMSEVFKPDQDFLNELNLTFADKEERLRHIKQESWRLMQEVIITDPRLESRRQSDGWVEISKDEVPSTGAQNGRPCSEVAVRTVSSQFESWRSRISHWILDALYESPLERAQHKAILQRPSIDNKTWWSLVKRNWTPDGGSGNESQPVAAIPSPDHIQRPSSALRATRSPTRLKSASRPRLVSSVVRPSQHRTTGDARTAKTI